MCTLHKVRALLPFGFPSERSNLDTLEHEAFVL